MLSFFLSYQNGSGKKKQLGDDEKNEERPRQKMFAAQINGFGQGSDF
jgi:hypothetical protein